MTVAHRMTLGIALLSVSALVVVNFLWRRQHDRLSYLLLVAFVLRAGWISLCPNEPVSDQFIYDFSARQIAMGRGYVDELGVPANYWPVGYSALLGIAYRLFGSFHQTAFVLNVALWLSIVAIGYRLALVLFGRRAAAICGGLLAVHPTFVLSTTLFASETPFIAGELAVLLAIVGVTLRPVHPWFAAMGIGVAVGLLTYVRPPALALLVAFPTFLWAARWPWPRVLALTALGVVCALMTLVPWGLRNKEISGNMDFIAQNGGANLWMGNNPATEGNYMELPSEVEHMSVSERDKLLKKQAVDHIVAKPGLFLVRSTKRLVSSLATDTIAVHWNVIGIERVLGPGALQPLKLLCTAWHYGILLFAAIALYRQRPRLWPDVPLLVTAGLVSLPFVLIVGGNRYMLPLIPLVALLGAAGFRDVAPEQTGG